MLILWRLLALKQGCASPVTLLPRAPFYPQFFIIRTFPENAVVMRVIR
jgi:hypothetical protein